METIIFNNYNPSRRPKRVLHIHSAPEWHQTATEAEHPPTEFSRGFLRCEVVTLTRTGRCHHQFRGDAITACAMIRDALRAGVTDWPVRNYVDRTLPRYGRAPLQ